MFPNRHLRQPPSPHRVSQEPVFDSDFSFCKHVQNVCKGCFIQLRDFRNIRQFLTQDAAVSVANALVSSRLDYCN